MTTPDRYRRAQEIFASAVTRSADVRGVYLDGACGDDAELRREVESLLASHEAAGTGFLESPAIEGMESIAPPSSGRKPLSRGARLGSFEIVGPLGAGGMGEVYRARDPRLGRDVAIKVLPLDVASDRERLKRFEKEARSASALNHPNIVTIYETGSSDGVPWIAMEHVEGETLRTLVSAGPLQIKKLLNVAVQIAEGLARAHEAGIVHRDLKPENVMVTKDGLVKILDFGLAKLQGPVSGGSDKESQLPTVTGTSPGIVLGTVGYMSPEQASGKQVDFRSDQFAFGSILYEMATARRAFQKKTAVETLTAILNDEPESIAILNPQTPAPLRWVADRCLQKEPRQRYGATEDLARDLANVQNHLSEVSSRVFAAGPVKRTFQPWVLGVVGIAGLLVAAYLFVTLRSSGAAVPKFQRITFQRGWVGQGRFAPDGQTVVYGMIAVGSDSKPVELYSTRVGSLDSHSLGLLSTNLFSISRSGQMAVCLVPAVRSRTEGPRSWESGTLAEASLSGGAPRPLFEDISGADWSPDGKELAVLHEVDGKFRIEYPAGKVLYESTRKLQDLRVSPDGQMLSFTEWLSAGALRVVDRKGVVRTLVEDVGENGGNGCWSPRGDEIWWLKNFGQENTEVHTVSVKGRDHVVTSLGGDFGLHDVSRDGRLLVERDKVTAEMLASFPGESTERNLQWLDGSLPTALSADGTMLLFLDRGDAGDTRVVAAYLRRTDGSPAVRLGEGVPLDLSRDGRWALVLRGTRLMLLPTGAGQEREISTGPVTETYGALFHPDGKRIFLFGSETGHRGRVYEQDLETGAPRALMPERMPLGALSQDGASIASIDENRNMVIFSTEPEGGTAPRTVTRLSATEEPLHWSADGRSILIIDKTARPIRVDRLDLSSGRRTPWRSFSPVGLLGGGWLSGLVLSSDERAWVVGYDRVFSELLVVDGLR